MRVGLLSGQVFSPFGQHWLAWSHGAALLSGMYAATNWIRWNMFVRAVGIGGGAVAQGRMVGFASCNPADALVVVVVAVSTTKKLN